LGKVKDKKKSKKRQLKTRQVAALPYRVAEGGRVEVLLVTSRETGRWLIPKGWPMKGKTTWQSAAQEAIEEAGVKGEIAHKPLGHYSYWKRRSDHFEFYKVAVFGLEVQEQLATWPEKDERSARWFDPANAAERVLEPDLADLIRELPDQLRQPISA
jgi:8-oxo-dGTP pyrophosphatase MutT (NUDIX family)